MRSKRFLVVLPVLLCAAILFWWNKSNDQPTEAAEDEIALRIQLDTEEDFGVLLIAYDANGSGGRGGISNVDKSLLKHDEQLFYTLPEHAFDNPSDVENLSIQFTIITEYVEPNFEEIYPEELKIPIDPIFLNADFGESYSIIIRGDQTSGYQAVLEQ